MLVNIIVVQAVYNLLRALIMLLGVLNNIMSQGDITSRGGETVCKLDVDT